MSNSEGGVPGATVAAVLAGLDALGLDANGIRNACELPEDLSAPELVLTESSWEMLWAHAHRARPEATLAVRVGLHVPFGVFGAIDYLVGSAPTFGAAIESLAQYFNLVARGLRLVVDGDELRIDDALQTSHTTEEFTIGALVGRFQPYLSEGFVDGIALRRSAADGFDELLGVPLRFDCRIASLHLHPPRDAPMGSHDPRLHQTMRTLVDQLDLGPDRSELEQSVRARLRLSNADHPATVTGVAKALGMSARTLHRRLADEGHSWQGLVDAHRSDEAERLLADGFDVTQVAFAIGFKDVSSFSRAFKRWKGVPPSRWQGRSAD